MTEQDDQASSSVTQDVIEGPARAVSQAPAPRVVTPQLQRVITVRDALRQGSCSLPAEVSSTAPSPPLKSDASEEFPLPLSGTAGPSFFG